ncbi:hypothetical protein PI124_g16390 [Phytophthora idaei]|nr:hypothetical protein PI125_g11042 [Phytophthora idaei]KAG3137375.1 hypothetical protein PI126_g17430 [Phytophthora idaei]KAG3238649.1 hypothetical protein PI124_g16390 [Phytophthora idaei]
MKSFVAFSVAAFGLAAMADFANAMHAYLDYIPNASLSRRS